MRSVIWKFPLALHYGDRHEVEMPHDAAVVHVGVQHGDQLALWALVDPDRPMVTRRFRIFGTGHEIAERVTAIGRLALESPFPPGTVGYVGTVMMFDGQYVWHVFEEF